MRRAMIGIAACTVIIWAPVADALADHIPEAPENVIEYEGDIRVFLRSEDWTWFAEAKGRFEDEDAEFRYRSITAGPYYRLFRNLALGAFYRFQQGARHDDDWIWAPAAWKWKWRDTTDRSEHVLVGDITPRVLLDFLPGEQWVAELKGRYLYNTFNDDQTVTIRPGITYIVMRRQEPLVNIYAQYELYFPLNYGVSTIYEKWLYLGFLYHAGRVLKLGLYGAKKDVTWGTSQDVKRMSPGTRYEVTYSATVIGFVALAMVDL